MWSEVAIRGCVGTGVFALGLTSLACGGSTNGASTSQSGNAVTTGAPTSTNACTSAGVCPTRFSQLTTMSSSELGELFDKGTMGDDVYSGPYSGLPLVFPRELPPASAFPQGAQAELGFPVLIGAIRLLTTSQMNTLSGFIWHGKLFTPNSQNTVSSALLADPAPFVNVGDVVNNIGRPDVDFAAEAHLLLDRPGNSIDLDYSAAKTGLQLPGNVNVPGISGITVQIIKHVWDRVRLINADEKLYVGKAYVVGTPGAYDDSAVLLAYFALTPEGKPAADVGH